jgi:WD40 repeat protein
LNNSIISGDTDGKIFSWSLDTLKASPIEGPSHPTTITSIHTDGSHFYSVSVDGTVKKAESSGDNRFKFVSSIKFDIAPLQLSGG